MRRIILAIFLLIVVPAHAQQAPSAEVKGAIAGLQQQLAAFQQLHLNAEAKVAKLEEEAERLRARIKELEGNKPKEEGK